MGWCHLDQLDTGNLCPNILTHMHVLVRLFKFNQWITRGFTELLYCLKAYIFYRYNLTHLRIEQNKLKCLSSLRCTPSLSKYLGFCHELWCLQYLISISFTLFSSLFIFFFFLSYVVSFIFLGVGRIMLNLTKNQWSGRSDVKTQNSLLVDWWLIRFMTLWRTKYRGGSRDSFYGGEGGAQLWSKIFNNRWNQM